MTSDQEERLLETLDVIAGAMSSIARTYELQYYKSHPPPRARRDITLSRPMTAEEKLRESQGATGEGTSDDWMRLNEEEIGPYEQKWLVEEERRKRARADEAAGAGHPGDRSPAV